MKVMFLGDVHGDLNFMTAAIQFATKHKADVIIQVGDFGIWEHIPAGVHFLDETSKVLKERDLWMMFCDGNHENMEVLHSYQIDPASGFRPIRDRILHTPRGHTWSMGELNWLALGGASSIDGPDGPPWWQQARSLGHNWWPEEIITASDVTWAIDATKEAPIDIMVTHDAPIEVEIPGITGYPTGDACRKAVSAVRDTAEPQLLVCGHYHRRHTGQAGQTRVEILSGNEQSSGHTILLDTESFTLITETSA